MSFPPVAPAVLILAEASDVHALAVASAVMDLGGRPIIFDSARYPGEWAIGFEYSGAACRVTLERSATAQPGARESPIDGAVRMDVQDLAGVWYRRIQPFDIPAAVRDPQVRAFAAGECRDAFFALLQSAPNVINDPAREAMANRKPTQLALAQRVGLALPETVITNDPSAVRTFWMRLGGEVVFKILTNTRTQFTETRVLTDQALEKVEAARYAPTIFQRKLEADHHLRVTVIDDVVFAARLEPDRPEARYDWRLDHHVRIEPADLEAELERKILALMRELGLRYGALDFVVTADGTPWFLEVNPSGQFLFVEIETRQGISQAIAEALLGRHAAI